MNDDYNNDDEYDILDDINPEDYILVLDGNGKLRGISLPESIDDNDDVPDAIAKIMAILLVNKEDTKPDDAPLH